MKEEKWITVAGSRLNGHLLELALFVGGRVKTDQGYKMRPFLGSDKLDLATNVQFDTVKERVDFQRLAIFINAYGQYEYKRGIEYGGSLLHQLGRAEMINSEVDYRLSSAQHMADWGKDGLDELKQTKSVQKGE